MKVGTFQRYLFAFSRVLRFTVPASLLFSWLVLPAMAQQLQQSRRLLVRVRDARGAPLSGPLPVTLRGRVSNFNFSAFTREDGSLEFRGLVADDYTIEVSIPGYLPAAEEVNLPLGFPNVVPQVFIYLRKESDVDSSAPASTPVSKDSKAQKEIQKARESLLKNDLKAAQKHLERALKAAPTHPEVHFLLGMLYSQRQVPRTAQQHLEKALDLYPQYVPALRALGRLLYQQGDLTGAIRRLEQALAASGRSADDHMLLAEALLQQKELEKAAFHARQAAEFSEAKQPQARLIICQVLIARGKYKEAESLLEAFLREFPGHADAPAARSVLQWVRDTQAKVGVNGSAEGRTEDLDATPRPTTPTHVNPSASLDPVEPTIDLIWAPPDVDANPPAVFHDVPCEVSGVLAGASQRIQGMAGNLGDVAAEENVSHTEIDKHGHAARTEMRRFGYEVSFSVAGDGTLLIKEVRDGVFGVEALGGFATNAIAVMALVFHPYYSEDFEMRCEGQGVWQGQPVWFVHFQQRADKPARIHGFRSRSGSFRIPLKGRAWIAANSNEIVRLETAMIGPIPAARLEREQMVIEYHPVRFKQRKQTFWLPASADIYVQYRGQRWRRRHVLSNYVHFAVDTRQKIATPEIPNQPPSPP